MPRRTQPPRPNTPSSERADRSLGGSGIGGLLLVIEYQDAAGRRQFRPVTLWSVKPGRDGIPRLLGYSHDRGDLRSFRLDRILSIADADGVLQEPLDAFYREVLGLSWRQPPLAASDDERGGERWAVIRRVARENGLVLAVSVARADLHLSGEEVMVMLDHVAASCAAQGIDLDPDEIERARQWIRRMRPSANAVRTSLHEFDGAAAATRRRVIEVCLAVADSDGFRHHRELALIDEFSRALLGESILSTAALDVIDPAAGRRRHRP
ncbi:TerB family tellurite resistance protein [Labrys sp. KNU-23]|uniref:tellurite resistance TerB family protein n=1 Tax=Labrys sp. KNU-23 TaxID=2789216 RepID=UPI00165B6985|nr:TerB family tellurite resistance protein [Labrys sp. KNU-23]